jgi:hypothetical protein
MVFGLPFNLFWLISWIVLSSGCLAVANRIQTRAENKHSAQKTTPEA